MEMNPFWKMIPVAAIAAFAFAACDSGSSSGSDAAESSSAAALSNGSESSGAISSSSDVVVASSSSVAVSSSSVVAMSSSSVVTSSSSVAVSSSSAMSSLSQGTVDPSTVVSGTMKDDRDGQVYKTVMIGTQTWMAENLNYAVDSSWCYNNSADSCSKYGRLYQWTAAMGVNANYNTAFLGFVVKRQGACPGGWHIPSSGEWTTLEIAVGGELALGVSETAGAKLKSTSGWYDSGNGTDDYGFSVLPAGNRRDDGIFFNAGSNAYFWSASEYGAYNADFESLYYYSAVMGTNRCNKDIAFPVRCVKN